MRQKQRNKLTIKHSVKNNNSRAKRSRGQQPAGTIDEPAKTMEDLCIKIFQKIIYIGANLHGKISRVINKKSHPGYSLPLFCRVQVVYSKMCVPNIEE